MTNRHHVSTYLNDEEYAALQELSKYLNVTLSVLLKKLVQEKMK
jgi:hypothetical protein